MNKSELSLKNIFLFLYYWLCLGFFLGTLVLMGPVRWLAVYSRAHDWSAPREKALVFLFIGILAVVSALCARLFALRTSASAAKPAKAAFAGAALGLFLVSLWFWMNPKLMIDKTMEVTFSNYSGTEFIFGPYPEKEKLLELKKEYYTAVISLLSPAVVPFEPALMGREAAAAKEAGIELISIPMLPWVSTNDHVEGRIEELVKRGGGKYYVHCYLGKDRVNIFKKLLSSKAAGAKITSQDPVGMRTLYDIKKFERGAIAILDRDVFFTPYPTDEEFFGYILNGSVKTLVSLLDPANKEDLPWITKEKAISVKYKMKYANYSWKTMSAEKKEAATKEIMKLEKPAVIHAFLSQSPECVDFVDTYNRLKAR